MKKFLVATLCILCACAMTVKAADATGKKELTAEQKAVMTEMLAKYDANKDGKLDKEEKSKMSQEDKDKMTKAGLGRKKKAAAPATEAPATEAPAATK
ncbi:MAG: hypothetical protein JWR19_1478 [Pedosphaera sp.]|nr:hypothetical protein [Pedosphaera sp.]